MRIRLNELGLAEMSMLKRLDDGPVRDSVGRETGELTTAELRLCLGLHDRGLVSATIGWRDTCWFRLTATGRRLRRQGAD